VFFKPVAIPAQNRRLFSFLKKLARLTECQAGMIVPSGLPGDAQAVPPVSPHQNRKNRLFLHDFPVSGYNSGR
jgi:hypothetical protein